MGGHRLADRAEDRAGDAALTMGAQNQHFGGGAQFQQGPRRLFVMDLAADLE